MDDDLIELGIKVLAMVHTGYLEISCMTCNEYEKQVLNCSGSITEQPVYVDEEDEFYTCPLKFLSQKVYDFYDNYQYHQIFQGTAPVYEKINKRYWECVKLYKFYTNKYSEMIDKKIESKNKEKTTQESLNRLKNSFYRK